MHLAYFSGLGSLGLQSRDNNTLHTEPRAARLFENNDVRRGPVNADVIPLGVNPYSLQTSYRLWHLPIRSTIILIPMGCLEYLGT